MLFRAAACLQRKPALDNGGRPHVVIVSASVGSGHDGAAYELRDRLSAQGAIVDVRDYLDALPAWLRYIVRDGYTGTVTYVPSFYDWLYEVMGRPGPVQRVGLAVARLAARRVSRWCDGADAVVSTYPLASQTLGRLVVRGRLRAPITTFLTDPAVHALWVNQHIGRHLTVLPGTARLGASRYRVPMTAVGPLVPEKFAIPLSPARRRDLRATLQLPVDRPVALVMAGSLGLGSVVETVDAILATGLATPLALCGRNLRLLRSLRARAGVVALGWRDDVHELMHACDVLVHNAGGLSFSESLIAGLPAVTYGCIPGHGKANGQVLAAAQVAPIATSVPELRRVLERQLQPQARVRVRGSVAEVRADASQVILADVRAPVRAPARAVVASPRRHRVARRRRWAALLATAVVVATWLGATEGVSAAAARGLAVARMPAGTTAVVVRAESLTRLVGAERMLRRLHAAVALPAALTPADLSAARSLARAQIPLLARSCPAAVLLLHPERRVCGAARLLHHAGVPTVAVEVSDGELQALDLVTAKTDATKIVLRDRVISEDSAVSPPQAGHTPPGGVWVVRPDPQQFGDNGLAAALRRAGHDAAEQGIRLLPVTAAIRR